MDSLFDHNAMLGSFFGIAIGDAMGAPVEFKARGSFPKITDFRAGGRYNVCEGEWTDDTAMALCLSESLTSYRGFDPHDQMRTYLRWYHEGYMGCRGQPVGMTEMTRRSLLRFQRTHEPYSDLVSERYSEGDPMSRVAPVLLHYADIASNYDIRYAVHHAGLSARTTHASRISIDANRLLALYLIQYYMGKRKDIVVNGFKDSVHSFFRDEPLHPEFKSIIHGEYRYKSQEEIKSTGYAVDVLEAALWNFYHTDSFEDAVLTAANLGLNASTVAAVTGQIAGAHYGFDAIPEKWLDRLCRGEEILTTAHELIDPPNGYDMERSSQFLFESSRSEHLAYECTLLFSSIPPFEISECSNE